MTNLKRKAQGRECQIRSPKCNHDPETTVLCRVHKPSISGGIGLKGNDMLASWGCSSCRDYVNGRGNMSLYSRIERDIFLYEGVFRTLKILLDEGKIGVIK